MPPRRPALSIRARLVLATALLLAAASLAPSLVLPSRLEKFGRQELERRALDIARAFATASEVAFDFRDRQRADEILRGLSAASGATYGSLLLTDGTVLAAWGPPAPDVPPGGPAAPILRYSGDQLHVRVAIATPAGEHGALQIGFDLEDLQRRREASRETVVATAAAVFAVGLGVLFLVATLVTKPVRKLTEVAERIAAGDETAARLLQTERTDETGTVAVALESVIDRLARQRAMLQSQSEASSEGILTLDLEGRVVTSNRRLREILAFLEADPTGGTWSALRPHLERGLAEALPDWLTGDAPALARTRPESFDLSTRDGRFLAVHASTVRRPSGEPLGLGLYFRDITGRIQDRQRIEELAQGLERRVEQRTRELAEANAELGRRLAELRRTQEQLVVADRRISVGRLAAGVAHEINNPLTYVLANMRSVADDLPDLPAALGSADAAVRATGEATLQDMLKALRDATDGAERVAQIVRGLKAFSRSDEDSREPVQLSRAMRAALDMAGHEIRHRARLVVELGDAPFVEANEVRVSQVFLNLLINAAQSITPGAADRNFVRASLETDADGWARAEIRDSGQGIPAEIVGRIFDPFFTTKAQGEGSGLGLSISQGIIGSYGGTIEVTSEPGRGSTFRVRLPPLAATQRRPTPPPTAAVAPAHSSILLVDDEPLVAVAMSRLLERDHAVTVASSGTEALARLRSGERFTHILCDLMMPGMSGMALHEEVLRSFPDQARVMIFMTGGAFTDAAEAFLDQHRTRFVLKPVNPEELKRAIHANHQP